jgi:hypothetical protein
MTLIPNFMCYYLTKPSKNTNNCNSFSNITKQQLIRRTVDITYGVILSTHPPSFITCPTRTFIHQKPLFGWDSSCANKIKVFAWLLLMDRLNVRNILRRKKHKLQRNDYSCVMCTNQCEETTFHLFFSCPFSRACWRHLGIN